MNTFMKTSRSILLRMRNISKMSCRENKNTNFTLDNSPPPPPPPENRAVYEPMWKNVSRAGKATDDNTTHALRILDNRLQTHTQNMYYLLLFHGSNGYSNEL